MNPAQIRSVFSSHRDAKPEPDSEPRRLMSSFSIHWGLVPGPPSPTPHGYQNPLMLNSVYKMALYLHITYICIQATAVYAYTLLHSCGFSVVLCMW